MWDWFDHNEDEEEEDLVMDFEPVTRHVDPLAKKDEGGEANNDLYDEEEKLFEKRKKRYQPDKEMELGFPDENQEFVAKSCLKSVIDEYNNNSKGRALKPIKKGMGLILHGDADLGY